jgi:hypothetical protein
MNKLVNMIGLVVFFLIIAIGCSQSSDDNKEQKLNIYLIALEGTEAQGKTVGCNDLLVPIEKELKITRSGLESALTALMNEKSTEKLKNFVRGPGLILAQVTVANMVADVYFKGDFDISGACDIPRIQEQVYSTVKQFPELTRINIFVNNVTFERYLSVAQMSFE